MSHRFPKVVLCLGLPGSASTWVYNIVRYLLGQTQRSVVAFYLDDNFAELQAVLEASEHQVDYVVLKSHKADSTLFEFLSTHASGCVLSVRDPRDCMVSLMERFDVSFEDALLALQRSCASLTMYQALGVPLLRYEDHFYRSTETILALKDYLGVTVPVDLGMVQHLHSQAVVERLIGRFQYLPPGRIRKSGNDEYDLISHWHRKHFGDGLSGKWHTRLTAQQTAQACLTLADSLEKWGYTGGSGSLKKSQ
ncbi:hypothetical protein [Burkholderia sp. L27(2015)]|uniref:hypothetical protein n=1 Tax=Burkholderia sp. L27(2015) TaxID=1641858 RepID=UPI00131B6D63|nr:hypothetical protein [Burkholderia sp. L27(2015)]